MSEKHFTDEQLAAIRAYSSNIIVSAGAGSGKTDVLSNKVKDVFLNHDLLPSNILVLTFTNSAAFEMKNRIISTLKSDNNVKREFIDQINTSHVQTFDSFTLFVFKKFSYLLNLNSNISIINPIDLKIKKDEILDKIIQEKIDSNDETFIKYFKEYCFLDLNIFKTIIYNTLDFLDKSIDKEKYLYDFKLLYKTKETAKKDFNDYVNNFFSKIKKMYDGCFNNEEVHFENTNYLREAEKYYLNEFFGKDIVNYIKFLDEHKRPTAQKKEMRLGETDKALNDKFKVDFNAIINEYIGYPLKLDDNLKFIEDENETLEFFLNIVKTLNDKLDDYKKMINKFTFDDIAKISYKLLDFKEVKTYLTNTFKFILIDEYQDTSDIQEAFINKFSNNNVYCVGDVKQSIYSFRNANCDIFNNKFIVFKNEKAKGQALQLTKNFRSRKQILDDVNKIFGHLFEKDDNINYKDDHHIEYGLTAYNQNIYAHEDHYGVHLLNISLKMQDYAKIYNIKSKLDCYGYFICQDIIKKMNSGFMVYDKDTKTLREAKFSDFCIIASRKKYFDRIEKVFNKYHVPIINYKDQDINVSMPIVVLKSIISLIYELSKDEDTRSEIKLKEYYLSIARSYLYKKNKDDSSEKNNETKRISDEKINDSTIYNNLKNNTYLDSEIIKKCIELYEDFKNNNLSLTQLVLNIIQKFEFIEKLPRISDPLTNIDNIEYFYNLTREFEDSGKNLYDLILIFDYLKSNNDDIKSEYLNTVEDAVNMMTIFKSKGLEWPIIYIIDIASNQIQIKQSKEIAEFMSNKKYGIEIGNKNKKHSFYFNLIKKYNKNEIINELVRLYYVAITRAREQCNIVTLENDKKEKIVKDSSFLSFIKQYINDYEIDNEFANQFIVPITNSYKKELELNLKSELKNKDKPKDVENITINNVEIKFSEIINKKGSKNVEFIDNDIQSKLDEGSKIHNLLSLIDLKTKDTSFINESRYKNVIDKFLRLDIFSNLKNTQIYKEYEFYDKNQDIHGFVDLIIADENEVKIIDYKLKNIDDEEYKTQLSIYKKYIQEKFKKPCKTLLISILDNKIKEVNINV